MFNMLLDAIVAGTLAGGKPSWIPLLGEGQCLGFISLGPTDWQGAQSATERAFESAEKRVTLEKEVGIQNTEYRIQNSEYEGVTALRETSRHQAIPQHPHPVLLALLTQQPQVRDTVLIHKEHIRAVAPPLRDMVRQPRYDDARLSRHATRLLELVGKVNK